MEINYELVEQDFLEFNIHHARNSATIKRSILLQRCLGPVMFLIMPFYATKQTGIPLWYWMIIFYTISIIWFVFYPRYINWQISRGTSKMLREGRNQNIFGNRSIILMPEGIREIGLHMEEKVSWSSIERIEETEDYIYIYISSVSAYIIPIKAFKDIEIKEAFKGELDRYMDYIHTVPM